MFPLPPLPQGALTKEQLKLIRRESPDQKLFYVRTVITTKRTAISTKRAKDFIGNGPGCYFTNYWFAYAHSLRVQNENKKPGTA